MRRILFIMFFLFTSTVKSQIIWYEDFSGLPDGTVEDTGPTAWDTLGTPSGYFEVRGGRMAARNTANVMTWRSEIIDISTSGPVNISVILEEVGVHEENQDFIRFYYVIDGGSLTPFAINFNHFRYGEVKSTASFGSIISGSTLQIVAQVRNNAWNEYMYFDNITVYQAPPTTLYARQNGNWNNPNTWSASPGGTSCLCIPDVGTTVYIDGFDILLNENENINNVHIANNANLNIENALLFMFGSQFSIDATSTMRELVAEAKVIFVGDANTIFTNNSTTVVLLDELDMQKKAKLTIEGSGDIFLNNDIDVDICDSLIFNSTGTITISDDLGVSDNNATIINNATNLVVLDDIRLNNWYNDLKIINHASITCNDFDFSNRSFRIFNHGNITNNGFINIQNDNEIHNYENADWTYHGALYDASIRLYTAYNNNTFIYGRIGNQQIIEPQDSYFNLELVGSGTKTTNFALLDIDRDLTMRDDAVLDIGTFGTNMIIFDDFESFSSQAEPLIPGSTTVTFEGTFSNEVRSEAGITFYDLIVNTTDEFILKREDLVVENNLNLLDGMLNTNNDGRIVIEDNATITGYDASKFINGPIQKIGDEAFIFPLGDNGIFRPLSMSAPGNITDAFTARHRDQLLPSAYSTASSDYIIDSVLNCSYYTFSRDVGSSTVQITYPWDNLCPVPDLLHLSIASWNGSQWIDEGSQNVTGNVSAGTISSEGGLNNYTLIALASRTLQPVVLADTFNLDEDSQVDDNLIANDFDPMGYNISANSTLVQLPVNGSLVLNANGNFTYTPNEDYFGADSVFYQVCNDAPNYKCDTAKVLFLIAPVNDAPLALNDTFQIMEDQLLSGQLLSNDNDVDGDPLTADIFENPSNGTANVNSNGTFSYTPNQDFFGNDQFIYQVCDDQTPSGCSLANVFIEVLPVNDRPEAVDDNFTTPQRVALNDNVLTNDIDVDSNVLQAIVLEQPSGSVTLLSNGDFTYTPDPDFTGTDQFTYLVNDEQGASDTAVVAIVVIPNEAPVANDLELEIYNAGTNNICIDAYDADGDPILLSAINYEQGEIVSLDSAGLCFDYIPDFVENSRITINYLVCDPWLCDSATINISILPDVTITYQALSPNNDGKNDVWLIDGIENYPNNEVKIFNRYGDLVFAMKGYDNVDNIWEGKANSGIVVNKSVLLPDGTYFFTINLGNGSKPKQGYVVIAR